MIAFDNCSAAALLAMQSAVLALAIPFVCLSFRPSHAGTVSRRMNVGSGGLNCEVAKHFSFLIPMVGGRRPFHLKFALKVIHPPLKRAYFDQYLLITS